MSLLAFFQASENSAIGSAIRDSIWLFPAIEAVHLLALAIIGGAVLVVDLRLLGLGLYDETLAKVEAGARRWLVAGFVVMLATGIPLFMSEAMKCYYNTAFWLKMGFLLMAAVFTFTVRTRTCRASTTSHTAFGRRLVGSVSLALWLGVGLMGRAIGFY